jgi:TetR/AcrR family transcriptional repressor of lmrAB and yxaGH operons
VSGDDSRARLVDATAGLMRRHGYTGTGLAAIVDAAATTKGSLYFHFPGGKEELAVVVVEREAAALAAAIDAVIAGAVDVDAAVAGVFALLRQELVRSDFASGCPITPVAVDVAGDDSAVAAVCRAAFARWHQQIAGTLVRLGRSDADAVDDAWFVLSLIEGALLLARSERSTAPLDAAERRLRALLPTSTSTSST